MTRNRVQTGDRGAAVHEREGTDEVTCPECDSAAVVTDTSRGEVVCEDCGTIVEEQVIDHGPEWRAFNKEERDELTRVGAPMTETIHDRGLTTTIDWRDKDAGGRLLSAEKRSQLRRLRSWQKRIRTRNASERNLQFALSEIDRMTAALGVPRSIQEMAAVIYRRALDEDLIRGRSIEGVASAAIYIACRKNDTPRSLEEITEVSRVGRNEIGRTYRYVTAELGIEMAPVDPSRYVPRFCSDLDLDEEVKRNALEIIERCTEVGLHSGKSPVGFAGAAVYLASLIDGDKRTQRAVAKTAGVTEVTIRNRYQEQYEEIEDTPIVDRDG